MNKLKLLPGLLIILMLALVACSPPPPPLPTVAVLPTDTATLIPSRTPIPSITPTPSNTYTPTASNTPTASITPTPSDTFTPTVTDTPLPTNTETPTDTPLPTDTATATFTFTPSITPTPIPEPEIKSLTADPSSPQSGSQVTVRWSAEGDRALLDLLAQGNALIESNPVAVTGERTFTVNSSNGSLLIFRLTVFRGTANIIQTVSITVTCPSTWFFSPAPQGCGQPQQASAFTYQQFERGVAFFVGSNNNVYFLNLSDSTLNVFGNDWNQSIILPTAIPPSGLSDPTGPIGNIWKNHLWSDGRALVNVVGWATAGSTNYNGISQMGPSNELYLRAPTGAVYRLAINGNTGTWRLVANS
ncbi:MAG: hypothetical protein ABI947_01840 [Chloroflexota bacterium]